MILHQQLDYWPDGRTWVVSDVHGCLDELQQALQQAGYQPQQDRLICLGDLIDRGPESYHTVRYVLSQPHSHVVLGNHELFFLNTIGANGGFLDGEDPFVWFMNGGEWSTRVTDGQRAKLWRDFQRFPLSLTVGRRDGSQIGLCHAEPPSDNWEEIERVLETPSGRQRCVWGRQKINRVSGFADQVAGVAWTLHGHTIVPQITCVGNSLFVDLGSFATGRIAVLDIEALEHVEAA